jgi:hypothetical protein
LSIWFKRDDEIVVRLNYFRFTKQHDFISHFYYCWMLFLMDAIFIMFYIYSNPQNISEKPKKERDATWCICDKTQQGKIHSKSGVTFMNDTKSYKIKQKKSLKTIFREKKKRQIKVMKSAFALNIITFRFYQKNQWWVQKC